MSTVRSIPTAYASGTRELYRVQRVLRSLIWFIGFVILGVVTFVVYVFALMVSPVLGPPVLVVGGVASLVLPRMISSSLYIIPEFERVVVLKMGKFVGVKGPGLVRTAGE